jgi:hypothetical protein
MVNTPCTVLMYCTCTEVARTSAALPPSCPPSLVVAGAIVVATEACECVDEGRESGMLQKRAASILSSVHQHQHTYPCTNAHIHNDVEYACIWHTDMHPWHFNRQASTATQRPMYTLIGEKRLGELRQHSFVTVDPPTGNRF